MSRQRDDRRQYTEQVSLEDVLGVFDTVEGPVVTSGDVAAATGCSGDTARRKLETLYQQDRLGRRKTAGRVVYWKRDGADLNPVDAEDPIFTDRPSFSSDQSDLSERTDEVLYGSDA